MNPLEILRLPRRDFHQLIAFALAAEKQNLRPLMRMQNRAGKKDMMPGIAAAVYFGTRAGK